MEDLELDRGLILTSDRDDELLIDGKTISLRPVWRWLLEGDGEILASSL
jgi:predicted AAA+ superfamily ATPase